MNDEATGYTNWADNEPSDPDGSQGEDCVEMYTWDGQWNDFNCDTTNGFVCMTSQRECAGSLTHPPSWILTFSCYWHVTEQIVC